MEPIFKKRKADCMGIDPDDMYGSMADYFCLRIHYGGHFVGEVTREYVDGSVGIIDMVEGGSLNMESIIKMVDFLGDGKFKKNEIYFPYFRVPGENLTSGLHRLRSEADVKKMMSYTATCRCISLYVENGTSTLTSNVLSSESPRVIVVDNAGVGHFRPASPEYNRNGGSFVSKRVLDFDKLDVVDRWVSQTVKNTPDDDVVCLGSGKSGRSSSGSVDIIDKNVTGGNGDNVGITYLGDDEGKEALVDVHVEDPNGDGNDSEKKHLDSPILSERASDEFFYDPVMEDTDEWYDKAHKGIDKVDMVGQSCELEDLDFDELTSTHGDDDNGETVHGKTSNPRNPQFNKKRDMVKPKFFLLQEFASKKELKDAIMQHSIDTRRNLKFSKNDKVRLRAVCKGVVPGSNCEDGGTSTGHNKLECPWTLHASQLPDESTWQIKTYVEEHWCLQTRMVKACTYKYLAEGLTEVIKRNPEVPVSALKHDLEEKYQVHVSRMKAFRAKSKAHNLVIGSFKEQYELLRDYCMEVIRTNPGSTMKIDTEPEPNPHVDTRVFRRIYCCLDPLKKGFFAGCRPMLGLDGTFIKGPFPGQLLAAVGIDANNGLFPFAWAIVEAENRMSWEWFLECLGDDLDLTADSNFCFMTDRQKGLIPALAKVFPDAEHRYCLKHIWDNFKVLFKGLCYKDLLWSAASATNVPYYEKAMDELKKLDPKAHEWLAQINPRHWSKSHFSLYPRTDILYNNLCETFNSKVLDARDKPIITCLENIRLYVLNRIVTVRKEIARSKGVLCPKIEKLFDDVKKKASELRAVWSGGSKYQVSGPFGDQVVVNLQNKSCTCRKWDLTAFPCKHAVRAIWCNVENGGDSLPENWVDECYKVQTWKKIYAYEVNPLPGVAHWTHSTWPSRLLPPKHHVQPGRPKKARRKSKDEIASMSQRSQNSTHLEESLQPRKKKTRKGGLVHCKKCGNAGHNSRTCKGQGGNASVQSRRVPEGINSNASNNFGGSASMQMGQPSGNSSFNNGSTYRVDTSGPRRGPIFGARGAMFWLGPNRKD